MAAAAQAARATAPAITRPQPARRASVAMDPTQVLHRSGVSVLGHLSDPLVSEAQASMAATGEGLMDFSDDEFGDLAVRCCCLLQLAHMQVLTRIYWMDSTIFNDVLFVTAFVVIAKHDWYKLFDTM